MKKCLLVGASGYTGAQLGQLIQQHPSLTLTAIAASAGSEAINQPLSDIHPECQGMFDSSLVIQSIDAIQSNMGLHSFDIIFLATPHEFSAQFVAENSSLLEDKTKAPMIVDLSGAFRLTDSSQFHEYYGFEHPSFTSVKEFVYGLPEIHSEALSSATKIAVAGCYPTASILALYPLITESWQTGVPVINAISGVSGAGKKANAKTSFCEVSLQPYGIGNHRHQPEIEQLIQHDVVFTPHLGNFKRGILATITVPIQNGLTATDLLSHYQAFYSSSPFVHVFSSAPAVHHVEKTPFAHIFPTVIKNGSFAQIVVSIDNLMKGAASNAIQCVNASFNWPQSTGLLWEGNAS